MKLIRRIADYLDPPDQRATAHPLEERAREVSWDALRGGVDTGSGIVSPRTAENLSCVLACVSAISSAMASLPAYVYRMLDRGRTIDDRHPVAHLINDGPNPHQAWCDLLEWLVASTLLRGNGLCEIVTDNRGAVVELRPIPWEYVNVQLLTSGRLAYDIAEASALLVGTGRPRRLLQDEVLHLRDRSDDGLVGRSRLQRAAAVVNVGLSMQTFADSLYKNGAFPSGALMLEGKMTDEQRERMARLFREAFAGPTRAARALLLDQGVKWETLSVSPEDAEFLGSRKFSTEELARLFGVPPPIIGDLSHGTFTNSETVGRWFATHTLAPWIKKVESAFSQQVFSAASRTTHSLEIDMSGFLRGDPAQRWAAWKIAREADILTVDEIREQEGFGPRGAAAAA